MNINQRSHRVESIVHIVAVNYAVILILYIFLYIMFLRDDD